MLLDEAVTPNYEDFSSDYEFLPVIGNQVRWDKTDSNLGLVAFDHDLGEVYAFVYKYKTLLIFSEFFIRSLTPHLGKPHINRRWRWFAIEVNKLLQTEENTNDVTPTL